MEFKPLRKETKDGLVGYARLEGPAPGYIVDYREAAGRFVPLVSPKLSMGDILGDWAMRLDIGRDDYKVAPGLYAIGSPIRESPILVTANYKLSFNKLRHELGGMDAWIVVLDTKGVNVWCAAGKGAFGTAELLDKIARLRLEDIVSHKLLILPQLGASGVSAPEIARVSSFRVVWGPVRAADIPAFVAARMRKTEAMRRVEFRLADRMAVAPVELAHGWPFALGALALSFLGALPLSSEADAGFGTRFGYLLCATLGSLFVGALAFPALLPALPTKAFSIKGAFLGALWGLASGLACTVLGGMGLAMGAAVLLASTAVVAFVSLNFTGSSTYTCQPGASLEVEKSIIPMAASLLAGIVLGGASRVFGL